LAECAFREVAEECGLIIANPRVSFLTNDIFTPDKHYITIEIVADYVSGEPQLLESDKCEEWKWFSWDNLPSPLMLPITNAIQQGFNPLRPVIIA
jgi:8-oxo-dGTP diphosphatase